MNKQEFAEAMQHKAGLASRAEAERALEAIVETLTADLAAGGSTTLRGFGTFKVKDVKERRGRNPATGKPLVVKAHRAVRFSPGKDLQRVTSVRDFTDMRSLKDFSLAVEGQLKDLRARLEAYRPKAEALGDEARKAYRDLVEKTTAQSTDAKSRIQDLSASGGEAWKEVRTGLERALGELRDSFKRAKDKF